MKKFWSGGLAALMAGSSLAAVADDAEPVNAFAQRLYGHLGADGGNLFISPASIHLAFAMVTAGAAGGTERELCRALALPEDRPERRAAMRRIAGLCAAPNGVTLDVANRIWLAKEFSVLPAYGRMLEEDFSAGFATGDFAAAPGQVRREINGWVGERTRRMIPELLPEGVLNAATRMVLVNAVYFRGDWAKPFPEARTKPGPFRKADGAAAEARFMEVTLDEVRYAEGAGVQWLALPYAGGQFDMVIFLPKDESLDALEKKWSAGGMPFRFDGVRMTRVHVTMPRFKTRSQFRLGDAMAALGVRQAFGDAADFSGITGRRDLQISEAIHEAVCDVTEKGTEAAAATALIMRTTAMVRPEPVVEFKADHPFVYAIVHRPSGLILFLGRYASPTG